jgi:hypothetical protein
VDLAAPVEGGGWFVNSSVGTGSSGWRCTATGVQSRAVSPVSDGHVRTVRDSYVWHGSSWRRTAHVVRHPAADADGNPPASTNRYPRFACPGLPANVL